MKKLGFLCLGLAAMSLASCSPSLPTTYSYSGNPFIGPLWEDIQVTVDIPSSRGKLYSETESFSYETIEQEWPSDYDSVMGALTTAFSKGKFFLGLSPHFAGGGSSRGTAAYFAWNGNKSNSDILAFHTFDATEFTDPSNTAEVQKRGKYSLSVSGPQFRFSKEPYQRELLVGFDDAVAYQTLTSFFDKATQAAENK